MADIKPTRSELLKLKQQIKLAQSGHKLLKKKRDGLILEFFEVLKKVKSIRSDLVEEYKKALHKINIARVMESDMKIKAIALGISKMPTVDLQTKNIMGVSVPRIHAEQKTTTWKEKTIYESAAVMEAASSYEKVVAKLIAAAEIETTMRKLLREIEKTKRRVNALEFNVIPRMSKQRDFIRLRLEEIERENIFRMKRIKKKAKA
ncbi:V-type ATP synthase subunit D [Candidatus Woesearchaeota archaeon]|nr:V-type ATP synthase subunit D [Candidatus Woesearchaeota archaeon]